MRFNSSIAAAIFRLLPDYSLTQSLTPADHCCAALSASDIGSKVVFPHSAEYETSVHSYFAVNAQLEPTCIVQPHSAHDVATAIQILTSSSISTPCQFAVRSGGHTTWAGAASIEPGVTIDLSLMNSITYNKDAGTATILPGARWESVYKALLPYNVTVTGGRTGPVGVGGFLIGGGNSFHTARVGFACDNVKSFEVVLATGRIINANPQSHPDLFKALKGGTINFGIVTRYDLQVIPGDRLWGGMVVYDVSTTPLQIPAIKKFIDNIHNDHYASYIGLWAYNSTTDMTVISTPLDYTKPEAHPAAFSDFYHIPNILSTMRFATMYDLTKEIVQYSGYREAFLTGTYLNQEDVLQKTVDILLRQVEKVKKHAQGKDYSLVAIIQPWAKLFWQHSVERGGNMLGLERFDENMFQVLWNFSWDTAADDDLFRGLAESAQAELDEYARSVGAFNEYIYLNYADRTQNPLPGYGEKNLQFMKHVAQKYDPEGVFQTQVPGGFKVTQA